MKAIAAPLFVLLALIFHPQFASAQGRKTALLIGVGRYAHASDWQDLNAVEGTQMLRSALLEQGFQAKNIRVLNDADATRTGIEAAFTQLTRATQAGDVVVFHFYGHGCQIKDDGRDEVDALDEAIVPFDGEKPEGAGAGRNLIRDDELGQWLDALRYQTGASGQVLALLDACHSGSGTRTAGAGEEENFSEKNSLAAPAGEEVGKSKSPFTAFFASAPHQIGVEKTFPNGQRCALLTWAFCKALARVGSQSTYRGLFEQIAAEILRSGRKKQYPQSEGALDMQVFGQPVAPPPPYFRAVALPGEAEIELAAGLLQGLKPGDGIALFPPETRDTALAEPLAHGVVADSNHQLLKCRVHLDTELDAGQVATAWVFTTERKFDGFDLPLRLELVDTGLEQRVRASLAALPAVRIVAGQADVVLFFEKKKLVLRSADEGVEIWQTNFRADQPEAALTELNRALGNYMQAQFLRELEFAGSPIRTDFGVQPEKKQPSAAGNASPVLSLRKNKDSASLTVVNRSDKTIFYTILDIDARNVVKVLIPSPARSPGEYALAPGESRQHPGLRFDAPGREVLKLIATPMPIDLRDAVETRGLGASGGSFFETLFSQTFSAENGNHRGPRMAYRGNEAGVETVVLEVE